jgi:hypothetical protein
MLEKGLGARSYVVGHGGVEGDVGVWVMRSCGEMRG